MTKKSNFWFTIYTLTFLAFRASTVNGMSGVNILNLDLCWYICSPIPVNAIAFAWQIIDTGVVSDVNGTLAQNPAELTTTSEDSGCYGIVTNTTGLQQYLLGLDFVFAQGLSCLNKTKSCSKSGTLNIITPLCALIINPTINHNYTFQYSLLFDLVSTTSVISGTATPTSISTKPSVIFPTTQVTPTTSIGPTTTRKTPVATNTVKGHSNRVKLSIPLTLFSIIINILRIYY
ncbi:hypothetical protein Glove_186g116 [Diversispora epigaea]|uniref:Uncharacterized protein n=1 Tax=Diversispora epigaea TaxID=1348612 RepID=A0A397IWM3_9GLOM|nr:hypothetical protein Glove_186g116 [Diversispora epigaea]